MMSNDKPENQNSLGKGEVESSILSRSTSSPTEQAVFSGCGDYIAQSGAEQRKNVRARDVENRWNPFRIRPVESPQCRVELVASGTECPAFCAVCGSPDHCKADKPRKLSTADRDLRGASLPAPTPDDIRKDSANG